MLLPIEWLSLAVISHDQLPTTSLLFSPVKLVMLVVWVYLCLYFVQLIEFGSLVPKQHKSLVNLVALLIGPILYVVLLFRETLANTPATSLGFISRVKELIIAATANIREIHFTGARGKESILLLDSSGKSLAELYSQAGDKQLVRNTLNTTEELVLRAINERASDILIDPKDDNTYFVRFRIDGVLRKIDELHASQCVAIVNSVKAVAGMDIAEKRRPQDGAFMAKRPQGNVSFRVASAGVLNGEKLAIRVLNQENMLTLSDVGASQKQASAIEAAVARPSGMVLVCGPTGSGKTTTLYSMLGCIDFLQRNVITVEDPIEYILPNASQIEINPKADITFAKALRSILRQDPDVICVGEIRDEETAAIALQASQTGHLVLATLHSNSNIATLVRLLDLKVSPLLLSSALSMIVSQRLVRVLCNNCKELLQPTQAQMEFFTKNCIDPKLVYIAKGCEECGNTGYRGRTGIFDILEMDNTIKANISSGTFSVVTLKGLADKRGASTLRKEGMKKVLAGVTTIDEIKRVTTEMGI